jgi:hypothetical protein
LATIEQKFAFSAHDEDAIGPTPGARNGHYVFDQTVTTPTASTSLELKGRVDCVWVEGHRAFFGGPIEKSSNPAFEGRFAYFDVADNDQPPVNGATPDQFRLRITASPTSRCFPPIAGFPITSGNIVVHDGQPNPPGPNEAEAEATTEEEALQQRRDLGIE